MEHNDFDEKIKDLLNDPPLQHPRPAVIEQFQKQLKAQRNRPKWSTWWPLLLLLPILLGMADLYRQNKKLANEIASFEVNSTRIFVEDTIVNKIVIYQVDTVFSTIYIERRQVENQALDLASFYGPESRVSFPSLLARSENRFNRFGAISLGSKSPLFNENKSILVSSSLTNLGQENDQGIENKGLPDLSSFPILPTFQRPNALISNKTSSLNYYPIPFANQAKKTKNQAFFFKPTGISIGAHVAPIVLPSTSAEGKGILGGIELQIAYPGARSLSLGLELLDTELEFKTEESFMGFEIPIPNNPSDVVKEIKVSQSFIQVPLMLHQGFFISPSVEANIGLGLVAHRLNRQSSKYEFLGINEEYGRTVEDDAGTFLLNTLRYKLGGNIQLSSRFTIEPQIQFQHELNTSEGEILKHQYWSFGVGGWFKLK